MPLSHEGSRAHVELIEGRVRLPRIGEVIRGPGPALPWLARDGAGREVEPVSGYLRDRMLGDISPLTCRSYAHDPLRWFRVGSLTVEHRGIPGMSRGGCISAAPALTARLWTASRSSTRKPKLAEPARPGSSLAW